MSSSDPHPWSTAWELKNLWLLSRRKLLIKVPWAISPPMRQRCKPLALLLLATVLLLSRASGEQNSSGTASENGEDLAGPIVRARLDVVKDALSKANLTGDEPEKKKTIAQIIDEALEQEFPEEKAEKIGKDFNETAKQEDVSDLSQVWRDLKSWWSITLYMTVHHIELKAYRHLTTKRDFELKIVPKLFERCRHQIWFMLSETNKFQVCSSCGVRCIAEEKLCSTDCISSCNGHFPKSPIYSVHWWSSKGGRMVSSIQKPSVLIVGSQIFYNGRVAKGLIDQIWMLSALCLFVRELWHSLHPLFLESEAIECQCRPL